jgi:hypothetical protein
MGGRISSKELAIQNLSVQNGEEFMDYCFGRTEKQAEVWKCITLFGTVFKAHAKYEYYGTQQM